jgi:hypothetical protein
MAYVCEYRCRQCGCIWHHPHLIPTSDTCHRCGLADQLPLFAEQYDGPWDMTQRIVNADVTPAQGRPGLAEQRFKRIAGLRKPRRVLILD